MDLPPSTPPQGSGGTHARLSFVLSGVMLVIYLGFILLVAFAKPFLASLIAPGLSWGILLGALVIASAWVLTFIYVKVLDRKGGAR